MLTSTCISTLCCFADEQLGHLFIRTGQLHCYSSDVKGVYSLDFTLNLAGGALAGGVHGVKEGSEGDGYMQGKGSTKTL